MSVSSQSDTEQADLACERKELAANDEFELAEIGTSEFTTARPVQAALTSAATFSIGAAMPLLMVVMSPAGALAAIVSAASFGCLALLGAIAARAGGRRGLAFTDPATMLFRRL